MTSIISQRSSEAESLCKSMAGWETGHLRGQDHGHRVVEHALTEEQSIQIHVHLQLVEDGQDGHCKHRQACSSSRISLN